MDCQGIRGLSLVPTNEIINLPINLSSKKLENGEVPTKSFSILLNACKNDKLWSSSVIAEGCFLLARPLVTYQT